MNPTAAPTDDAPRRANRLAREQSPYLLQHQFNPVDWHPWGEEAFARARTENCPIFLSIGYSTCHWCHVMERESFEDPATADRLNRAFVSIKVDREERPDVDRIYMSYVQAISGQGGWPLNVFLTPDLKPFFGGTYFPPERRHGRIAFGELLDTIATLWAQRPHDVHLTANSTCEKLASALQNSSPPPSNLPDVSVLHQAVARFKDEYDAEHGGFGHAPKFPRPSQPRFLLAQATIQGDAAAQNMVIHTCDAMANGGMHDHVGGGFARYAVDAKWIVPHFEKMLYDNAQLLDLYVDVYQATGEPRHAQVARGIVSYVLRDLTIPQGGFTSAEDADSEGKEGRFYCWTWEELQSALAPDAFSLVRKRFGVSPEGNFIDHSDPEPLPGQNVLHIADEHLNESERAILETALKTLLAVRSRRPRPHLDDKVLTSWNGLMLGALARASRALHEPAWLDAARRNAAFLRAELWDSSSSTLYHRWRGGQRDQVQLLEAYAFLLGGILDLYEATIEPAHLGFALELGEQLIARFQDREGGGFWQSQPGDPHLILQLKEDYDGALPSGNAAAILGLLRLSHITGRPDLSKAADLALRSLSPRAIHLPQAVPFLLTALDFALTPPTRIVIHGKPESPETTSLLQVVHELYLPRRVILGTQGPVDSTALNFAQSRSPAAQVCLGTTCLPPVYEPEALRSLLVPSQSHP